jgi:2-C-methyl-D-erythritol 4-phosphate cytidylyltransferase
VGIKAEREQKLNCTLIIPSGGSGRRFGATQPKQFTELAGIPIIIRTLKIFESIDEISNLIIPSIPEYFDLTRRLIEQYGIKKPIVIIEGGAERQDSVYNALQMLSVADSDIVLIHDAVRCLATDTLVKNLISVANKYGAAIPGIEPNDTIKLIDLSSAAIETIERRKLRAIQTPQVFRTEIIIESYKKANAEGFYSTDDAALAEHSGYRVQVIDGERDNIKITTVADLSRAELILKNRR